MSAGGAFGGARGYQPKPPEKGVFPLDHFGECTPEKEAYMQCLKESKNDAEECKEKAQKYLECRMSKSLMAQQDLEELGFGKGTEKKK
ncbi:Cytochrome c oxidase assembly protein COX19 [Picochlorum sp. SENEW3]|nr:Cytochrome c oxidase assembly protein COX19 [Picochlorum sp. SENEW3]WPT18410.1 Cytochrome c oxidase assembly protein COX19 [Picochlorum sp. SENEW3]